MGLNKCYTYFAECYKFCDFLAFLLKRWLADKKLARKLSQSVLKALIATDYSNKKSEFANSYFSWIFRKGETKRKDSALPPL